MASEHWNASTALLENQYGLGLNDAGIDEQEWALRYEDLPPQEAVDAYAEKYDLSKIDWR